MKDCLIQLENISYIYPDGNQALKNINLSIDAGERVALVGANGSGKSTLQLHLNGIILPQAGTITVGEYQLNNLNLKQIRKTVGLVFQNPDDQLFMPTVGEDVSFGPLNLGLRGVALKERVLQALMAVNLAPEMYIERNPDRLSGGEKKRVAIAGVLAMQPELLVLDEPTAQLDPRSRRQLLYLLESLTQTQIIATHDLDLALDICSRTVILNQGEIVYDGCTLEVMNDLDFLRKNALESPLSLSRPYCSLDDAPQISKNKDLS